MGQLIVSAQMTADSVMDHMEDWLDPELASEQDGVEQLRAADALILGRKTYERLAAYWPNQEGTHAELVNPIPKYVASHTIKEPLTWNSQLLGTDPADEVAALKEQHAGDLVSYGCGELANYLARRGLVDKVTFWLHAVVWGDGVRAFHAGPTPSAPAIDFGNDVHVRGCEAVVPAARCRLIPLLHGGVFHGRLEIAVLAFDQDRQGVEPKSRRGCRRWSW